jgi:hypothetical protein
MIPLSHRQNIILIALSLLGCAIVAVQMLNPVFAR